MGEDDGTSKVAKAGALQRGYESEPLGVWRMDRGGDRGGVGVAVGKGWGVVTGVCEGLWGGMCCGR